MIRKGADIQAVDKDGDTSLGLAILHGKQEGVAFLLIAEGIDLFVDNKKGRAAIQLASDCKMSNLKDAILSRTVTGCSPLGKTSLHAMAAEGDSLAANFLLDQRADIQAIDDRFFTPLHWAVWNNHYDTCRILLQRGADHLAVDREGRTPLMWAERRNPDRRIKSALRCRSTWKKVMAAKLLWLPD